MSITKIFKSSGALCTAPTGKRGKHCGRPIKRTGRLADGATCGRMDCQIYLHANDL